MPKYKDPFEKGKLFIKFKVIFPPANFANASQLSQLEKLLPPRPPQPMVEGDVEEKPLEEFDADQYARESNVRKTERYRLCGR